MGVEQIKCALVCEIVSDTVKFSAIKTVKIYFVQAKPVWNIHCRWMTAWNCVWYMNFIRVIYQSYAAFFQHKLDKTVDNKKEVNLK